MDSSAILIVAIVCSCISSVIALIVLIQQGYMCDWVGFCPGNQKENDSTGTAPGPSGNDGSTGPSEGGECSGDWKKGGVLSYYDVTDPVDGGGWLAGLNFKPSSKLFDEVNVVSVLERDWNKHKYGRVDLRFRKTNDADAALESAPVFTADMLDYCSNNDCADDNKGCCTRNAGKAKEFAGVDEANAALFDVEQRTLQRVLGDKWSIARDQGLMNVEYRFCDDKQKASKYNKYK